MAITKDQKVAQVQDLTKKMGDASSLIFAQYIGLSVAEISDLRTKLREQGAEMKVAKKTLIQIASKEAGLPEIEGDSLEGAVSVIFSYDDPLTGAQIAFKFAKDHKQVALVGGVFDGKILTKEQAVELAKMPGREELLATFVGMIRSPMNRFASLCNSPLSSFARALDQIAEKGGLSPVEETAAPAAVEEAPAKEEAAPATEEAPAETAASEETAEEPAAEAAPADSSDEEPAAADA